MGDRRLTDEEKRQMATPAWELAKQAIRSSNPDDAIELIDLAVDRWRSLQDFSINWITSLLSFIGEQLGEPAVEEALRRTGEEFVRPRRDTGVDWDSLPARIRAGAISRAMVANFGDVEIDEDDEKIVLSFHCGSGGRLIEEGKYGDDGYLVLKERSAMTFERQNLPVYCAHCSVNNEIQPVEWGQAPITVQYPPSGEEERCVHHIYRDMSAVPVEVYRRIGKAPRSP